MVKKIGNFTVTYCGTVWDDDGCYEKVTIYERHPSHAPASFNTLYFRNGKVPDINTETQVKECLKIRWRT